MKNEKVAVAILVIIVVAGLSSYLVIAHGDTIFQNIFGQKPSITIGDCADVHYIGRYAHNNTIFDSSYSNTTTKTGGTPLKIFVSFDDSEFPPVGYERYSADLIEGFLEGLVGLEEGITKTIGPIPPEKAYGAKLGLGDSFNSDKFAFGLDLEMLVTELDNENISVYWVNVEDFQTFTMPQFIIKDLEKLYTDPDESVTVPPPYFIWKNNTSVIQITNDSVIVQLNPDKEQNLVNQITPFYYGDISTMEYVFPEVTTAEWNDTTVTLISSPEIGDVFVYTYSYFGMEIDVIFTVEDMTDETINLSTLNGGEKSYEEVQRVFTFDRTFEIPRQYNKMPFSMFSMLYADDIYDSGFSTHPLAGYSLLFEVTIEKVYKIS